MQIDEHQALRFFVYIVESPSAQDLYHGRSEGELVARTIGLDGIPCISRTTVNTDAFITALRRGLPDAMREHSGCVPILHISAHGDKDGIQLANDDFISWQNLRGLIMPINQSLGGILLLCMSACSGYAACKMAMTEQDEPHPYFALVANFGSPTWSDTAVAYAAFYHRIAKGANIPEALAAMKAASGDYRWVLETAEQSKRGYIEYVNQTTLAEALRELEQVAEREDLPPDAKALENAG